MKKILAILQAILGIYLLGAFVSGVSKASSNIIINDFSCLSLNVDVKNANLLVNEKQESNATSIHKRFYFELFIGFSGALSDYADCRHSRLCNTTSFSEFSVANSKIIQKV